MGKYEPLGDFLRSQHTQEVPVTFDEIERITGVRLDRKSTRLNSSHSQISYAVFCLKKKTSNSCSLPSWTSTTATCRPRFSMLCPSVCGRLYAPQLISTASSTPGLLVRIYSTFVAIY